MIDFNKYRYIGTHNQDNDKAAYDYDDKHYQDLIRNNRYSDAADYLSNFEFYDADEQRKHLHYIDELRRNGGIMEAVYSKLDDDKERNEVEFADKVGTPGWYDSLRWKTNAGGTPLYKSDEEFAKANPSAASVVTCLDNLGNSLQHKATRLSITFSPIKVGLFGWNWSKRNDTDDLDEFYNNGGFTRAELEAAGVKVEKIDKTGETYITFDKTNAKAIDILAAIPYRIRSANQVKIDGWYVDDKGNYQKIDGDKEGYVRPNMYLPNDKGGSFAMEQADIYGYTPDYHGVSYDGALTIRDIIADSRSKRDKIFRKRDLEEYELSSTVFDLETDRTDQLTYLHNMGQLSDAEYNRRMKDAKDLVGWFRAQTYVNGVYSNVKNKEFTDEHFEGIGQEEWNQIKEALGEFDDKDIIIQGQTVNGEIGLRFTLPQALRKKRQGATVQRGFSDSDKRNIQIFIPASAIPGMLGKLQERIDNDTKLQAVQDFNDMVGYGVKKTLYTGEKIYVDESGTIVRDNNGDLTYANDPISKEKAIQDLNQTRILEKGRYLKFHHINNNGDLNYATYEEDAKRYAILAANDLIDVELRDFSGNPVLSRNSDGTINYGVLFNSFLDSENYETDVYRKILKIREIYNILMNEIYNYNTI